MLTELAANKPDVIVFELGDGILGHLRRRRDPRLRRHSRNRSPALVLSANDPVAAWGGVKLLRERFGVEPCAVTGPATDNAGRRRHHPRTDESPGAQRAHRRRRTRRLCDRSDRTRAKVSGRVVSNT
jgi:hypothetical protein